VVVEWLCALTRLWLPVFMLVVSTRWSGGWKWWSSGACLWLCTAILAGPGCDWNNSETLVLHRECGCKGDCAGEEQHVR
jgi:hypothetical protein